MHPRAGLALILIGTTLAGCREQAPTAPTVDLAALVPQGSVQVLLQEHPASTPGERTFAVRVIGSGIPLTAYQGAVTFAPGSLQLVRVDTPVDGAGEIRIVNANDFSAGRIRFAALATEQFASDQAFQFTIKSQGSPPDAGLLAALDVAGLVSGSAIKSAQLKVSGAVRDYRGYALTR